MLEWMASICAGEQLPVLYYKEGERLSELSNYVREWEDQLVEVPTPFLILAKGPHRQIMSRIAADRS